MYNIQCWAKRALLNTRSMVDVVFSSLVALVYVIVPWGRRNCKSKLAIRLIKSCPSPWQLCQAILLPLHKASHQLISSVRIGSRYGLVSCSWQNTLYKRLILFSSCALSTIRLFVLHGTYTKTMIRSWSSVWRITAQILGWKIAICCTFANFLFVHIMAQNRERDYPSKEITYLVGKKDC